jgi:hypothetical protein
MISVGVLLALIRFDTLELEGRAQSICLKLNFLLLGLYKIIFLGEIYETLSVTVKLDLR